MTATDSILVKRLVEEINLYLDRKQQTDRLWKQVEMHMQTSYLAESLGATGLVPLHLQAAARLIVEAKGCQDSLLVYRGEAGCTPCATRAEP